MTRHAAAAALSGAGRALTWAAAGAQKASQVLRPDTPGPVHRAPAPPTREPGRVSQTPSVPVAEPGDDLGVTHARTFETHTEELATRPASEVIDAIDGLSTDELRRLYEHEQQGRRRRTVLEAIERALEPSSV